MDIRSLLFGNLTSPVDDRIGEKPLGLPTFEQENLARALGIMPEARPAADGPSGMFGIRGTGRDILGILGDSLLVGSGADRLYKPGRDAEEISDALGTYANDPTGSIARMARRDPKFAREYQDQVTDNEREARKASIEEDDKLRKTFGGIMGAANERTYEALRDSVIKRATSLGRGDIVANLPQKWDQAAVSEWARGTMTAKDQADVDYRATRAEDFDLDRESREKIAKARNLTSLANTYTGIGRLRESMRTNQVKEGISQQRADDAGKKKTSGGVARPAAVAGKPKPFKVDGEGNILVLQSDGTYKKR